MDEVISLVREDGAWKICQADLPDTLTALLETRTAVRFRRHRVD